MPCFFGRMNFPSPSLSEVTEDIDVASERVRVGNLGNKSDDVLVLQGLTKVDIRSVFCNILVFKKSCFSMRRFFIFMLSYQKWSNMIFQGFNCLIAVVWCEEYI